MDIELVKATESDAEEIWNMQKVAFAELLNKYQDFETNPANEPLVKDNNTFEATVYLFLLYKAERRKYWCD
ncbi:MAG: hypothetical protein ACI4MS_06665 [Candidatus Coproplasma sp.]